MSEKEQTSKGLLDYIHLLLRWRWFIIVNFLCIVLITYGITLLLPKWYYSQSVVLPPRDKSAGSLAGLGNIARMVGVGGPASLLGNQEIFSYMSILKSRTLQQSIVREFDLIDAYKIDNNSVGDALEILRSNTVFKIDEEGALVIGVFDRVPQRAADMANRFVELLHEHNTELSVSEARARRKFIERRLDQNRAELAAVEEKVRSFQTEHGLLILPDQADQSVRGIAEMYAARVLQEIERDVAKEIVGTDNPMFRRIQIELDALNRRLVDLPDQTIESFRIARDLLIQQKIFELLTPLLEEARLEELRDTPTVLILDRAIPAEEKARPKRLFITIAMGMISLLLSTGYIVSTDIVSGLRENDPERYKKVRDIHSIVRNPFKKSSSQ
jgi:tyrosine-protein kinase Etk/Wzc